MKVLFVVPEIRLDDKPYHFPFWAGILAAIAEKKGIQVAILDLNSLRDQFGRNLISNEIISEEISIDSWDLIGIGGLTTTYSRLKQLIPLVRKSSPPSIILSGGGWATYNPDEILQLIPEIDMICIGEGEETFSEICDEIISGRRDFEKVRGLCLNNRGRSSLLNHER